MIKIFSVSLVLFSHLFAEIELFSNKNTYIVGEHIEAYFSELNSSGGDYPINEIVKGTYGFHHWDVENLYGIKLVCNKNVIL